MLNVIRADLYKLKHLKSFYVVIVLSAFFDFVILADLSSYPDSYQSTYGNFLQIVFYPFTVWQFMPMVLPLALGILICLFVTNDFSYGTMKDPVTLGHSRFSVFFSKCLVASMATVIILIICMIVSIFTAFWMFDGLSSIPGIQDIVQFGTRTLLEIGLSVALAVLFTTLAFVIKHTAVVMAVHFSVALFVTMIIGAVFLPGSSFFYAWLATAMVKVSNGISIEMAGTTLAVTVIYLMVSFVVGYSVFANRDMK
ncbi:hypothetical protein F3157_08570 [Virgibacillus dakarensis]|uniref:ABC transporter permease n=1 Tax=Lentibacillus populi TaxID=1827502 RepID=A0A9W5TY80_9BACI|nr:MULTISPECIES: ABC transporter permease [Bacillaceae]MBT2215673.1 ABC transporter permease [Virgibacillus dakarensis]MTW85712.1 hypothetical protein [Virgibacillus dakarensis]GGB46128.1 hypothetical protein GCM10011409_24640 [Lentibacillus populi]